jgi:O-antigen ligase
MTGAIAQTWTDAVRQERASLLALLAVVPLGMLLVAAPFISAGVLFGSLLLATAFVSPLGLLGVMFIIGPIDLSFMTGGFKSLFASAGGLDMNGIRLIGVAGGLGIIGLFVPHVRRVLLGPFGIVYVVFLVYAAFSIPGSASPVDGLRLWLKIAYPLLIFGVVAGVATRREQVDRLLDCALIGAALVVFLSVLLTMSGRYGVYEDGLVRVRGVTLHENPFSFYLLIAIYMAFARFAVRAQWRYLLLSAALGVWLVFTLTRITFLAGAVGMIGIALYAAIAARNMRVLFGAAVIGLLIAVPLTPIVLERSFGFVPTPAELIALARSPMALYESINWQGRELVWPIVFASFLNDAWTGMGLGASTAVMQEYFPPQVGLVVHNEYLRLASETGVIGVVLFATAIMLWLVAVIRSDRRSAGVAREFTLPALAGIISWSILAMTDNLFDYYAQYTQFIGLLVGACLVVAADVTSRAGAVPAVTSAATASAGTMDPVDGPAAQRTGFGR